MVKIESDVRAESERITRSKLLGQQTHNEPLLVKNVSKVFKKENKPFFAVDNLTFGVWPTECFGLLGLNGAGKTTTLQILTGQVNSTRGEAYVNGFNIETDRLKATREFGFCPQFVIFFFNRAINFQLI